MNETERWTKPDTVRGFVESPPNERLLQFAAAQRARLARAGRALDIGCGAARNAGPLGEAGWAVTGIDTSRPMLTAAAARAIATLHLIEASMSALPCQSAAFDLTIAHGIWNLASSDQMFRAAVAEAARVTRADGALFVFTFSRATLPPHASPVAGATFTFDQFANMPQVFLTAEQLVAELDAAGFVPDPALPLRELNRPCGPMLVSSTPVIYEGGFRRTRRARE